MSDAVPRGRASVRASARPSETPPDPRPDARPTRHTRRDFLALTAGGVAAAVFAACGGDATEDSPASASASAGASVSAGATLTASEPSPTPPAPLPVPPAGRSEIPLLPGTAWETLLVRIDSGVRGPVVMVLGGVHGNEPGGWLAAESVARWEPVRGSLLVVPRANTLAVDALERTLPDLGDLNRLYPGERSAEEPMSRMAWAIVETARAAGVGLLLDLHESWAFYVERTQNGTAFLGQTITAGPGDPAHAGIAEALARAVNEAVEPERDRLVSRDFTEEALARQAVQGGWFPGRGGSSLSLGRYVRGLTPVLVEMGQQDQPIERREELHRAVVRAALTQQGMLDA